MAPTIWTGSLRKQRIRYPLGPLNGLRHLERDLWCTESIVPIKAGQTEIRCDMLVRTGTLLSSQVIQKWKAILEKEAASFAHSEEQTRPFSYECDGKCKIATRTRMLLTRSRPCDLAGHHAQRAVAYRVFPGDQIESSFPLHWHRKCRL